MPACNDYTLSPTRLRTARLASVLVGSVVRSEKSQGC